MEAIIITEDGIMIQDLSNIHQPHYNAILRVPTVEEISKISDACSRSVENMQKRKEAEDASKSMLELMYEENCRLYGEENVRMGTDHLVVIFKGKERKIWVE